MRSQETRLRRKWSHMPCNLVNFISVSRESEVGRGWQWGEEKTRQKKKGVKSEKSQRARKRSAGGGSVTTTTDLTMSSDVRLAQSLCKHGGPSKGGGQEQGGEEESKRKRGLRGACAALLEGELGMRRVCPHTCSLCHACCPLRQVRSCLSMCYSVHKRWLWWFFQRPGRDDNGNVDTKPVCSSLLQ